MTDAESRNLAHFASYFNANKLSYLMRENVQLAEDEQNRLLRYDGNTREIEKLQITKKLTKDEQATIAYLDDRKRRLVRAIKEKHTDDLEPAEIEQAIEQIEALGLADLMEGQIYFENILDVFKRQISYRDETPADIKRKREKVEK